MRNLLLALIFLVMCGCSNRITSHTTDEWDQQPIRSLLINVEGRDVRFNSLGYEIMARDHLFAKTAIDTDSLKIDSGFSIRYAKAYRRFSSDFQGNMEDSSSQWLQAFRNERQAIMEEHSLDAMLSIFVSDLGVVHETFGPSIKWVECHLKLTERSTHQSLWEGQAVAHRFLFSNPYSSMFAMIQQDLVEKGLVVPLPSDQERGLYPMPHRLSKEPRKPNRTRRRR